eukprot:NODE_9715_length_464_cov_3.973494_g8622_i0.p4 GENE.NODE_9715_length_464_cov_3.973494_g8622_i0~~NODE_9715_length_464_cov_3.973494_g8622_i0.p4  ORF type:complete len:67 (-),score=5.49 NODE_9715_length_464_cov_3.973494_g8622_i0:62-262(-)
MHQLSWRMHTQAPSWPFGPAWRLACGQMGLQAGHLHFLAFGQACQDLPALGPPGSEANASDPQHFF